MSYIDEAKMILFFGEQEIIKASNQEHDDPDATTVNSPVVADATKRACSMINSWLAPCYQLPLPDPLPANLCILETIGGDIARFLLNEDDPSEDMIDRYENAVDTLKELCPAGPALVDDDGNLIPAPANNPDSGVGNTETGLRCRVFTIDRLAQYQSQPRHRRRRRD